jgi:hypothetical protein
MLTNMVWFLALASVASPPRQATAPPSTAQSVSDFHDVTIGMDRDRVLAGLAGRYKLAKEDAHSDAEWSFEVWGVSEQNGKDLGKVLFENGKVVQVRESIAKPLAGDAVSMARTMFAEFYSKTAPPQGKVNEILGRREPVVVTLTLDEYHNADTVTQSLFLESGRTGLQIEILTTGPGTACDTGCVFLERRINR